MATLDLLVCFQKPSCHVPHSHVTQLAVLSLKLQLSASKQPKQPTYHGITEPFRWFDALK